MIDVTATLVQYYSTSPTDYPLLTGFSLDHSKVYIIVLIVSALTQKRLILFLKHSNQLVYMYTSSATQCFIHLSPVHGSADGCSGRATGVHKRSDEEQKKVPGSWDHGTGGPWEGWTGCPVDITSQFLWSLWFDECLSCSRRFEQSSAVSLWEDEKKAASHGGAVFVSLFQIVCITLRKVWTFRFSAGGVFICSLLSEGEKEVSWNHRSSISLIWPTEKLFWLNHSWKIEQAPQAWC